MERVQVDKSHYIFGKYVDKKRLISMWHQLDEVLSINAKKVLEVGKGAGLFEVMAKHFGTEVETVDIALDLNPDVLASATSLPFKPDAYDCVCAFQVLEHLPYERALLAFREMLRVTKKHVIISLPDAKKLFVYSWDIPRIGRVIFHIPRPRLQPRRLEFDGEHYWEINRRGYPLQKMLFDFTQQGALVLKTYRVPEYPQHRFFVFKKGTSI